MDGDPGGGRGVRVRVRGGGVTNLSIQFPFFS